MAPHGIPLTGATATRKAPASRTLPLDSPSCDAPSVPLGLLRCELRRGHDPDVPPELRQHQAVAEGIDPRVFVVVTWRATDSDVELREVRP